MDYKGYVITTLEKIVSKGDKEKDKDVIEKINNLIYEIESEDVYENY